MSETVPDIIVTPHGSVTHVELNRPPHNYFDEAFLSHLADALQAADHDVKTRAIVLAARGKSFCAGADLARPPPEGGKSRSELIYDQARRLFSVQTPIVAAIEGAAIGGGLGLAMVADYRVSSARARFAANFAQLGFHPGFALTVTLPRALGHQMASELLLTGRRIDGAEAARIGLADRLVEDGATSEAARALAEELASAAPLAVAATRATLRAGLTEEIDKALDHELAEQVRLRQTEDFREGVAAAKERRRPDFNGC